MSIQQMIEDGVLAPGPYTCPNDLVTVVDIKGRKHRVRQSHIDDGRKRLLRFNQYGVVILAGKMLLHKDNIQK